MEERLMLVEFIRKYIGGVRFALTFMLLVFSLLLVGFHIFSSLTVDNNTYLFLGGLFAQVSVFVYAETKRRS